MSVRSDKKAKSELRQESYVTASTPNEMVSAVQSMYKSGWRRSFLLLGEIGVGKSESVKELGMRIAASTGRTFWEYNQVEAPPANAFVFVDVRLTDLEPADLTGIPRDDPTDGNFAIFKPQKFVKLLTQNPGLLFLDEITNEQRPNMKAASYKVLRDRTVGFVKLHENVLIIGAGNYPDDAVGIAEPLPAPMINRVCVIEMKAPELKDWIAYMQNKVTKKVPVVDAKGKPKMGEDGKPEMETVPAWDTRVGAFLQANSSLFLVKPKEAAMLENFPTPRSWTDLSKVSANTDIDTLKKVAEGTVGKEAALHFIQFISTQVDPIEDFVKDPSKWDDLKEHSEEIAAKYLLSCQIADKWASIPAMDDLCLKKILKSDQDYMGMIFSMLVQKNKNEIVQRCMKKDKAIMDFVKNLTFWNYNTMDADGTAIR